MGSYEGYTDFIAFLKGTMETSLSIAIPIEQMKGVVEDLECADILGTVDQFNLNRYFREQKSELRVLEVPVVFHPESPNGSFLISTAHLMDVCVRCSLFGGSNNDLTIMRQLIDTQANISNIQDARN